MPAGTDASSPNSATYAVDFVDVRRKRSENRKMADDAPPEMQGCRSGFGISGIAEGLDSILSRPVVYSPAAILRLDCWGGRHIFSLQAEFLRTVEAKFALPQAACEKCHCGPVD